MSLLSRDRGQLTWSKPRAQEQCYLWVVQMAQPTDPSVVETGTVQDGVVLPNRYKSGSRCRSSDEELELMEAQEDNGGT